MPTLSAALIVKNEARFLGGCLESLRGLVDEIVVVDTGSTDATVEIARSHGAVVSHRSWDGRFDTARNASFDRCTGDWILYIDADERVQKLDRRALDAELAAADLLAARVGFTPRAGSTPYREWRLYRRHPELRFRGAIHETALPALDRLVAAGGWRTGETSLCIDHLGYEGDLRPKHLRNLPLLQAEAAADPGRIYLWSELGRTHAALGDAAAALAAWDRGLALARANPRDPVAALPFLDLLTWHVVRGEAADALAAEALARFPTDPNLAWLAARDHLRAGRPAAALPLLEGLVAAGAAERAGPQLGYDQRLFDLHAYESLGLCWFRLGDFAESARWYRQAAEHAPDRLDLQARASVAQARAAARGPA